MSFRRTLIAAGVLLAACKPADTTPAASSGSQVDSQYSAAAMIAKFRQTVPSHPTALGGGATTSIDSLLARYVRGIETRDTTLLASIRLDVSEFAWLYYLDSPMAQKPYELDPDVMWMQIGSQSQRGLVRALDRFGGKQLSWTHTCTEPKAAGALQLFDCTVSVRPRGDAAATALKLSAIAREGRYKLTGLGTSL